jgi:hypothetical protein
VDNTTPTFEQELQSKLDAIEKLEDKIAYLVAFCSARNIAFLDLESENQTNSHALAELTVKFNDMALKFNDLNGKYAELQAESTTKIERISKELAITKGEAGQSVLSIVVDGERYTTKVGRSWKIAGKSISGTELVKDQALCEQLVASGSPIFTKSKSE